MDTGTCGAWSVLGAPLVVAQLARSGFDWVALDAQHGSFDRATLTAALSLCSGRGTAIAVRVSTIDDAEIGFALDAGAEIVIVPMVETPADAEAVVAAAHYPPRGRRSFGPLAPLWGSSISPAPRVWAMIETGRALDGVSEIAAVPGLSGLFVGPFDLALALGCPLEELLAAQGPDAPLERIRTAAELAGIELGAFAGTEARAARLAELGYRHRAIATDSGMLETASAALLERARPAADR